MLRRATLYEAVKDSGDGERARYRASLNDRKKIRIGAYEHDDSRQTGRISLHSSYLSDNRIPCDKVRSLRIFPRSVTDPPPLPPMTTTSLPPRPRPRASSRHCYPQPQVRQLEIHVNKNGILLDRSNVKSCTERGGGGGPSALRIGDGPLHVTETLVCSSSPVGLS